MTSPTTPTRERLASLDLNSSPVKHVVTPSRTGTATARGLITQLEQENTRLRLSNQATALAMGTRTRQRIVELQAENALLRARAADPPRTSVRTREALAKAEEENRRLRASAVRARTMSSPSALRALHLMKEVNARFRRELRTIDVLYMLDCTVSMKPWIRAAASKVSEVAHHLAAQFPTYTIRYGFLGYRDFENSPKDRFVEMPFTDRIVDLQAVLDATRAIGNTDDAEDVVGALAKAVKFEWKARTRVLYHFADCPSHFKKFHDGIKDHYPEVDPDGRSSVDAEKLLRKMGNLGVDYYFVQIKKKRTAKMVTEFKKIYDNDAEDRKLQILDLGSDTTKFLPTVVNTIASSVAKSTRCDQTQTLIATSILDPDVTILPKIDWDRASEGWGQLIRMESIACNLQRPLESVIRAPLEDLLADHIQAYIRPEPFAKGGVRYALPMFQPKDNRKLVAKTFRHGAREMSRFFEVMATQAIATKLVSEFNRHNPVRPMGFIDVRVVEVRPPEPATGTEGLYFTVEPFIEGEYVRHNNNAGWSNEAKATAQAFSHFSWIASGKRLVVVDLQGVEYVMTDPVIHSVKEPHFGPTDFAQQGINLFFASHRCNFVCAQLNLPPHPLQPSSPLSIATDSLLQELELSGPRQVNCGAVGCPAFVDIGIDGMLGVARTMSDVFCDPCNRRMAVYKSAACDVAGCGVVFKFQPYLWTARGMGRPTQCPSHRTNNNLSGNLKGSRNTFQRRSLLTT